MNNFNYHRNMSDNPFIDKAIFNYQNNNKMVGLCEEINKMMSQYPIFEY